MARFIDSVMVGPRVLSALGTRLRHNALVSASGDKCRSPWRAFDSKDSHPDRSRSSLNVRQVLTATSWLGMSEMLADPDKPTSFSGANGTRTTTHLDKPTVRQNCQVFPFDKLEILVTIQLIKKPSRTCFPVWRNCDGLEFS
jgi:hypothetical protein